MMRTKKLWVFGLLVAAMAMGCGNKDSSVPLEQDEYFEGIAYDEQNPDGVVTGGKEDGLTSVYEVPTGLPELENPEIIVSTESSKRDQERGLALGANSYLVKPFSEEALWL